MVEADFEANSGLVVESGELLQFDAKWTGIGTRTRTKDASQRAAGKRAYGTGW